MEDFDKTFKQWSAEMKYIRSMGYDDDSAKHIKHAMESDERIYGKLARSNQICPATQFSGSPKQCHGACIGCPFALIREADLESNHHIGDYIVELVKLIPHK